MCVGESTECYLFLVATNAVEWWGGFPFRRGGLSLSSFDGPSSILDKCLLPLMLMRLSSSEALCDAPAASKGLFPARHVGWPAGLPSEQRTNYYILGINGADQCIYSDRQRGFLREDHYKVNGVENEYYM